MDAVPRGIFLRAVAVLPLISVSLKIRGFRGTQQFLLRFLSHRPQASADDPIQSLRNSKVTLTVRMVNAAARHAWRGSTCLEKSVAIWSLLRQQGIVSELRIGARKLDGRFEAHAWVERDGEALNEPQQEHRHYATFDTAFPLQSSERL
jgi:hypothetical protein